MIAALLALTLAAPPSMRVEVINWRAPMPTMPIPQGPGQDGGVWAVHCTNCSGGGGESSGGLTDAELRAAPVPVTGSFYQATQPVSLASLPTHGVTGTFWQATQPVSGTLTCNAGTGTQAVSLASVPSHAVTLASTTITGSVATTGTYWQATQPVSIASMPTTAVTGTFFQTTQPVSGSVSVSNFPASTAVTGTFFQPTQPVSGTFWQATQPISGSVSLAQAGTRVSCTLTTTATTSTQITGCEVSGATSIYITDISIMGGVATGATVPAILQSGTSTACTGQTVLYRCFHPALGGCIDNRITPIQATAGHGLCLLDATAGTKVVTIGGYRL